MQHAILLAWPAAGDQSLRCKLPIFCSNRWQNFLSQILSVCALQASSTSHSEYDGTIDIGKIPLGVGVKRVFHLNQRAGSCVRNPVQVSLVNRYT